MKLKIKIFCIITFLTACAPEYTMLSYNNNVIEVENKIDSTILEIIHPYKYKIQEQMDEVLTYTKNDLEKERPQSTIGNFVTDLCLDYAEAHLCVMNNGGLRTTINKGKVSRRKIYELMPFENELVILELDKNDYIKLINYIVKRGGEPFSGITITIDQNYKLLSNSWPVNFENGEKVKVLTSDYLANGGDSMTFFKSKKQHKIGIKLRDAIIEYCEKTDTIDVQLDNRIKIINNE